MSNARKERRGTHGLLTEFAAPLASRIDNGAGLNYFQSAHMNARMLEIYRNEILTLAMNRFRWINLPASVDAEALEFMLATTGQASLAFPEAREGVFIASQFTTNGQLNQYYRPTSWRAVLNNGNSFEASYKTGTVIYDNETRFPLWQAIEAYAQELADIYITKRVNLFHQRVPMVLTVPQDKELDAINIAKQVGGGEPMIIGTDGLTDTDYKALTTKPVPYIGGELTDAERAIWARVYDTLGIPNVIYKAERQITYEVEAQQEETSILRLSALRERRKAARELNTRFYEPNLIYPKLLDKPIAVVKAEDIESYNWNEASKVDFENESEEGEQ